MYYLFSKFYWRERERETTCAGGTKKYNTKTYEPKIEC